MSGTTRSDLLAAAERLFAEHGYASVGIRQIAAAAGTNLSAIGYHFGSKQDLYLAALRAAVSQPEIEETWDLLAVPPRTRAEAGRMFVAFVRRWLGKLLTEEDVSNCTRLVLRETLRPTAGLEVLARDFARPHEERLANVVGALAPQVGDEERQVAVRAVIGQLVHYLVFREFYEHLSGRPSEEQVARIADHLARFTLRALGCSEAFVARALERESHAGASHPPDHEVSP